MRIKGKNLLVPYGAGKIDLIIDSFEDLWTLYNIIGIGDFVKMAMFRKVQHETGSKVSSTKKKLILTIKIEEIEYSPEVIRIKGKNVTQNEFIAIGQYQTTEISKDSFFSLYKSCWDDIHLETLQKATDVTVTSELAAIVMEEGVAHLFYISDNQMVLKGKIVQSIPKKRNGSTQHDKGKENFFEKVFNQLVKQINFENTKVLIIASPGFTKDDFKKYMEEKIESNVKEHSDLKNNLNKIIYTHSSSGYRQALDEILAKPEIKRIIKNTKCIDDCAVMERFNEILGKEMDKAFFGAKAFEIAYEKKAIETLIVTDGYLRKLLPQKRKELSMKLKELKEPKSNVEVCQFSSQHNTGEKVDEFGGIIGILKYVVPELSEIDMDEGNEEGEGAGIEKKESKDDNDIKKDEGLMDMINDKTTNYNTEEGGGNNDEDEPKEEDGLGVPSKKKKSKEESKSLYLERKKQQRKRSSFGSDEDS